MEQTNLLEQDYDLHRIYLALQHDVLILQSNIARRTELSDLTSEATMLMLRNFEEIYMNLSRSYYRESILGIHKLVDGKLKNGEIQESKNGAYGLLRFRKSLLAFVDGIKSQGLSLNNGVRHEDFIQHLDSSIKEAITETEELKFYRDKFIAHSDDVRIKTLGFTLLPDITKYDEFQSMYRESPSDDLVAKCANLFVKIFEFIELVICGKPWPKGLRHGTDLSHALRLAKEISLRRELADRQTDLLVEERMNGWWPYRNIN